MVRLVFASTMGAIGYMILFAGIAERGRWALRPWDALWQATNTPSADTSSSGSGGGGSGVVGKVVGVAKDVLRYVPVVGGFIP
jgi:hypothetical protein